MTPTIEIFGQNFAHFGMFLGVIFDHFRDRKSHFLDFIKVVFELFGKCLGIVFDLKRPTFVCIFSLKGR